MAHSDFEGGAVAPASRARPTAEPLLALREVSVGYGRNPALQRISLSVRRGESLAVAGSNGAGKTSLLGAIAGVRPPGQSLSGHLEFDGVRHDLAERRRAIDPAISLVPERAKVFGLLSVDENLRVGLRTRRVGGLSADDVFGWFPRLRERRATLAGNLSGGEQQMLGIGLALMSSPALLLLDEPTLGLAVPVIDDLCDRLSTLRGDLGLTIIVAESDSQWLPRLADRALVIDRGVQVQAFESLEAADLDVIHNLMLGIGVASGIASRIETGGDAREAIDAPASTGAGAHV